MTERADNLVETYSGGMRKRLEIAEGLLHRPKVLFLDEPTLGLDLQTRAGIWDYIKKLNEEGITIFLTTHYMEEADSLCDRLAIIDHGSIVASGTPSNLKSQVKGDVLEMRYTTQDETAVPKFMEKVGTLSFVRKVIPNAENGARAL